MRQQFSRKPGLVVGAGLVAMIALCAAGAAPKRVLVLDSFSRELSPYSCVDSSFRTTLAQELGEPVDFAEVALDLARFGEPQQEGELVDFLKGRFASHPPDLVVPIGAPASRFVATYRDLIFPGTPVLFAGAEPRTLRPEFLRTNATCVSQRVDLPGVVEDMLQLQPDTTNILVVFGASALEKFWADEARREFQPYTNRVTFTWLDNLSLKEILRRVANPPPHSSIFFGLFIRDSAGVPHDDNEALEALHAEAKAPMFAVFESQLGRGMIGGRLYHDAEVGAHAARAAIRILHGERPETIPPEILPAGAPVYDWRELRRWDISETRLPPGSTFRYREPGLWEHYQHEIALTLAVCLAETAIIVLLVANLIRRRRAEQALRESEERMVLAAAAADLGAWGWNIARNEIWASASWRKMFGFPAGSTIRIEELLRQIHAEDRAAAENALRRAAGGQADLETEFRLMLPEGGRRWIALRGRLSTTSHEPKLLGVALDMTARRVEQERFHQIVELSPSGLVLANGDGVILLVNRHAEEIFGYDRGELIGRSIELLMPEPLRRGQAINWAALRTGVPPQRTGAGRELRGRRKTGGEFPVELAAGPLAGPDGPLVLYVIMDISVRKGAELELARNRTELAHLARVTTFSQLAGSLAHELNQPLTAVLSNAEAAQQLLEATPLDMDELRDTLRDIVAENTRASLIIGRMRSMMKKGEACIEPHDLNEAIREMLSLVHSDLVGRNVSVSLELSPRLPLVSADRVQLEQVLLNLVLNGCDAMNANPPDHRQLVIGTQRLDENSVQATVADCGPGIDPGMTERIFEPFYSTKAHGLGLGLSICQSIITSHGGRLWAENNPDRGAAFHFTLLVAKPKSA